jgi:hypothetical protein
MQYLLKDTAFFRIIRKEPCKNMMEKFVEKIYYFRYLDVISKILYNYN